MLIPAHYAMLNTAYACTQLPDKRGEEEWHGFSRVYVYGTDGRVNICAIDGSLAVKISYKYYEEIGEFAPFSMLLNKQHLANLKDQFLTINSKWHDIKGRMMTDIEGDGRSNCLVTVHVPADDSFLDRIEWFEKKFFPPNIEELCATTAAVNLHVDVLNKLAPNQYGWKNVLRPQDNHFDTMRIRPVRHNGTGVCDGSGIFYVTYPTVDIPGVYHDLRIEQVFMGWAMTNVIVKE